MFTIFNDAYDSSFKDLVEAMGFRLRVKSQEMPLWLSLNSFALGTAVSKSGLSLEHFSEEARIRLQGMFHNMDIYAEYCFESQNVLHAPSGKRCQEAASLWSSLRGAAGPVEEDAGAELRLVHLWMFLQFLNVYCGEARFVEGFVMSDEFHHTCFAQAVQAYVVHDNAEVHRLVKDRLLFWALTLVHLNVYFNPRDGRRLCDTGFVEHPIAEDDGEFDETCCDPADLGPSLVPAPHTLETNTSGCPRVAFRSRWFDTALAMQISWWRDSLHSAVKFCALLNTMRQLDDEANSFIPRWEQLEESTHELLTTFIAVPIIGAASALEVPRPTHSTTAKAYHPKFLLSYSFTLLRLLVEDRLAEIDTLARRFTCYGPAPRLLFQQLTGVSENNKVSGVVAFARAWRNELQATFGIDFELYTIQYLPCLFHRACPALHSARTHEGLGTLEMRDSPGRERSVESAKIEVYILRARLQYLRSRPKLWAAMQGLNSKQRARIFRELDLVKACKDQTKPKAIKKNIADVARDDKGDLDPSLHWNRERPVFHDVVRIRPASLQFAIRS